MRVVKQASSFLPSPSLRVLYLPYCSISKLEAPDRASSVPAIRFLNIEMRRLDHSWSEQSARRTPALNDVEIAPHADIDISNET